MEETRKAELARIHIGKTRLGLDDETYRDLLERETGKRSAAKLTTGERHAVLDAMREAGFSDDHTKTKPGRRTHNAHELKARALWRALYNLSEVHDPGDAALDRFAQRQTGVAVLAWLDPAGFNDVIAGLRGWCARAGFDAPVTAGDAHAAKVALARAIWARLFHERAAWKQDGLDDWVHNRFTWLHPPRCAGAEHLDDARLDDVADALGAWLRRWRARKDGDDKGGAS